MKLEEKKLLDSLENVTTAIDFAISDKTGVPLPLSSKLFESAFYVENKDGYSVFHMFTEEWGLGNHLYQEVMTFLAEQDDALYAYVELDRATLKMVKLGNVDAFSLPLLDMVN